MSKLVNLYILVMVWDEQSFGDNGNLVLGDCVSQKYALATVFYWGLLMYKLTTSDVS